MSTDVYYFSASGNSLAVARDLAGNLNGRLISIARAVDQENIRPDADVMGLIFPVYYASLGGSGIPLIVDRFVGRLEDLGSRYVFAVCTHRGAPGSTIEHLAKKIETQGGELAAGFAVKMSKPYPTTAKVMHFLFQKPLAIDLPQDAEERRMHSAAWQTKLEAICAYVNTRKRGRLETRGGVAKLALAPLVVLQNRMALARYQQLANSQKNSLGALIPLVDRGFQHGPNCTGCGTCASVCPVNNIAMADGKPVWQHHCETCYACFQWCPRQAICGESLEYEKRYHHPDVKLADMLQGNGPEPAFSNMLGGGVTARPAK